MKKMSALVWENIKIAGMVIIMLFVLLPLAVLLAPISTIKALHRIIISREIITDIPYTKTYENAVLEILEEQNLRQYLYTEDLREWPPDEDDGKLVLHFKGKAAASVYTLAIGNTLRNRIEKRGVYVWR